jgi:hypothetical protein
MIREIIFDISKIALDRRQFRYIYNSDITKWSRNSCLEDIIITTAAAGTAMATSITAATRSGFTAVILAGAILVADWAGAWVGSSTTATCASWF